jgi:hypothetical protein
VKLWRLPCIDTLPRLPDLDEEFPDELAPLNARYDALLPTKSEFISTQVHQSQSAALSFWSNPNSALKISRLSH